jgi:hypothetical protein
VLRHVPPQQRRRILWHQNTARWLSHGRNGRRLRCAHCGWLRAVWWLVVVFQVQSDATGTNSLFVCLFFLAFLNFFIIITQNTHHQRQPTMRRAAIIIAFSHVFLKFLKKVCHTFSKTIIKSSLFTS